MSGGGGIEIFPQHYRGYLKKSRFTKGEGGDMKKKEVFFGIVVKHDIIKHFAVLVSFYIFYHDHMMTASSPVC